MIKKRLQIDDDHVALVQRLVAQVPSVLHSNTDAIRGRLDMLSRATASGDVKDLKALVIAHPGLLVGRPDREKIAAAAAQVALAARRRRLSRN